MLSRCSLESVMSVACGVLNCTANDLATLLNAIFGYAAEIRICGELSLCQLLLVWESFIYCGNIFISNAAQIKTFIH